MADERRVTQAPLVVEVAGSERRVTQAPLVVEVAGSERRVTQALLVVEMAAFERRVTQAPLVVEVAGSERRVTQALLVVEMAAFERRITQALLAVETGDVFTGPPALRIDELGADYVIARVAFEVPSASAVEYQLAALADTTYSALIASKTDTAHITRYQFEVAGLGTGLSYRIRARWHFVDASTSAWAEITFAAVAPAPTPGAAALGTFVPDYGARVGTASVNLAWDLVEGVTGAGASWRTTLLELITNRGATVTTLKSSGFADATADSFTLDPTSFADGVVVVRLTATNSVLGATAKIHHALLLDKAGIFASGIWGPHHDIPMDAGRWAATAFVPAPTTLVYGGGPPDGPWFGTVAGVNAGQGGFIPGPTQIAVNEFDASVIGCSHSAGGGFTFWWQNSIEATAFGLRFYDATNLTAVLAEIKFQWVLTSTAWGDNCAGKLIGIGAEGGKVDLRIYGAGGASHLALVRSDPVNVAGSFVLGACRRLAWNNVRLRLWRQDRVANPNLYNYEIDGLSWDGSRAVPTGQVTITPALPCGYVVPFVERLNQVGESSHGWVAIAGFAVAGVNTCAAIPPDGSIPLKFPTAVTVVCDCATIDPDDFALSTASRIRYRITLASDPGFVAPVHESGWLTIDQADLAGNDYEHCRVPGDYLADYILEYADASTTTSLAAPFTIPVLRAPGKASFVRPLPNSKHTSPGPVVIEIGAAIDPDGDPLQYLVDFSLDDGETYTAIEPLGVIMPGIAYHWDITGIPPGQVVLRVRARDACLWGPPVTICIEIIALCPEEPVTPTYIDRLGVWTDLRDREGECLAWIGDWTSRDLVGRMVHGRKGWTFTVPQKSRRNLKAGVWKQLAPKRVVRTYWARNEDDKITWEEWRIVKLTDERTAQNELVTHVEIEDPVYDLGADVMEKVEADGSAALEFGLYGKTVQAQAAYIMSFARKPFRLGHVDSLFAGILMDMDFDGDTVLAALYRLAEVVAHALPGRRVEIERKRVCNGHAINILRQVGAPATAPSASFAAVQDPGATGNPLLWRLTSTSTDADGYLVRWTWTVNNVVVGVGTSIDHTFPDFGGYEVKLEVEDNTRLTATAVQTVTIVQSESGSLAGAPLGGAPLG